MTLSRRVGYLKVYTAPTPFEAHFVRSLLEQRGVPARVMNENFSPYGTIQPEVWIAEADLEVASEVLEVLQRGREEDGALSIADVTDETGRLSIDGTSGAVSLCPGCGEENPSHFEVCWQCGESIIPAPDG